MTSEQLITEYGRTKHVDVFAELMRRFESLVIASAAATWIYRTLIGACDPQSGLNVSSLSLKSDAAMLGRPAGAELIDLATRDGDVWTLLGAPAGTLTASVRDNQVVRFPGLENTVVWQGVTLGQMQSRDIGNLTVVKHVAANTIPDPPPPPRDFAGTYLGFDGDHLGDGRSKTPDGKLDHHLRLTGLRYPIKWIEVKAGSGDTDWKWSDRAGGESDPKYAPGGWWIIKIEPALPSSPTGVLDIWLSEPTPSAPHTDFRVYVGYTDEWSADPANRDLIIPTPVVPPTNPPPVSVTSRVTLPDGSVYEGTIQKQP